MPRRWFAGEGSHFGKPMLLLASGAFILVPRCHSAPPGDCLQLSAPCSSVQRIGQFGGWFLAGRVGTVGQELGVAGSD